MAIRVALCVVILSSVGILKSDAAESAPMVTTVRLPTEGIAPQAVTDGRGRLHLIYFKGDPSHGDIVYLRSDDDGKTFTMPLRVNSQIGSAIAIGTVRAPQMAVGKNGRVHVAWMGSNTSEPRVNGRASPMLYSRMSDAGDAFEAQKNVITQHPGLDGGGSVAADNEGNVYVAWHAPRTVKGEADRWVWIARSADDGKTFAPEVAANSEPTGVCGCCGMKIAAGPDGEVYVAYRSAKEMVNRDMNLLVSKDHAVSFVTVVVDPWRIGTCAMSTSAFGGSALETAGAWETKGHIRFFLARAEQTFEGPLSVPGRSDNQKHPAVAVNNKGQVLIAWAEGTGWNKGGSVAWQVFEKNGDLIPGQFGRQDGLPPWSMPAAFTHSDGTFGIIF